MNGICHLKSLHVTSACMAGVALFLLTSSAFAGGTYEYADETATRLPTPPNDPALSTEDPEEKDFAWGDLDLDGDIDLVVVRKEPLTTPGRRRNVLFMNEGGVLIDRTTEFASAADDGGEGFLDLTNDRDVVMVDVDNDGWLDVVTAPTSGQGLPKTISHPRVYMNQGESDGKWQGLLYEEARFPILALAPNFCGVAAGDVTGDGFADLYFVDYLSSLEDRLLINIGNGFFIDESKRRMTEEMLESGFGINTEIADVNNDGWNDVIKSDDGKVTIAYNGGEGFFNTFETIYVGAAYSFNTGELNNDGLLDVVIIDDSVDQYLLNQGNGGDGLANFAEFSFPNSTSGFGGNSVVADLDNDGWNEVLITDVDIDAGSCNGLSDILSNNEDPPFNTFLADSGGIPDRLFRGVHDIAVFDIDGDCWLDLVVGRCGGITVWINQHIGSPCDSCIGDLDGDGSITYGDLLAVLSAWGNKSGDPADLDSNGIVGTSDLLIILANWGVCE